MSVEVQKPRLRRIPILTPVYYGDRVDTPEGIGTVKGTQRIKGEPLRILVALDKAPKHPYLHCNQVLAFWPSQLRRL